MVFQRFNLFPHLTALQNVTLAPRKVLGVPAQKADQEGRAFLERVHLGAKADSYPGELSGGQQQLEVMLTLAREGRTMLVATHEMGFCREVASRVLFLDSGVIREQGPPDQIFGAPREERTREFLARVLTR